MNLYKVKTAKQVATSNGQLLYDYKEHFIVAPHIEGALGFMRVWLADTGIRVARIKEIARDVAVVTEA